MYSAGPAGTTTTTAATTTTQPSSPPPPSPTADPALDPGIEEKLIASGDRDRLQRLLAERLEQCGWRDQVAALARDALAGNYHPASPSLPRPHTADALAAHLRPAARAAVPDGIKAELLAELRAAVLAATTGTRAPTAETTMTT